MISDLLVQPATSETPAAFGQACARTASTAKPTATITVVQTTQPAGWEEFLRPRGDAAFPLHPDWTRTLGEAFGHSLHWLEARQNQQIVGVLPLVFVQSRLFGRRLCSLPYLNSGGVVADTKEAASLLIDRAVQLASDLDVKHLELRHERAVEHPALNQTLTSKVHLRLPLPETADELWDGFKSKLRSQIRKPLSNAELTVHFGGEELLHDFYRVFCINMRDLGTPPYSQKLFAIILRRFPGQAELCIVRHRDQAVAGALLVHGPSRTQVPSASTIRSANPLAANMLMYWHLLKRATERGQKEFDFGRSTVNAGTYQFKKQWGAEDHPAIWQYFVRTGQIWI